MKNKQFVRLDAYSGFILTLSSDETIRLEHGEPPWLQGGRDAAWQGLYFDNRRFYRWRGKAA